MSIQLVTFYNLPITLKNNTKPGVVVCTYNLNTWEAEAGRFMLEAILVFKKDGRNQPSNLTLFLCTAQKHYKTVYLCWWYCTGEEMNY